jgi:hypothetical protein
MDNLFQLTVVDDTDEVFAVSFVADPAIERDFVFFNKAEVKFQSIDDEKRLVAGPLLVPDKRILRLDEQNQPYHVYFTADTIEKIAQKYMMKKYNDSVTYEHAAKIGGVSLVESWVVANSIKDKSNHYGFTMPKGTWFGIFKVNNDKLWNDIKQGRVSGFSIEGEFEHKQVEYSKTKLDLATITEEEAMKVLAKIKHIIKSDGRYRKGERIDMIDLEGEQPSIISSYPGQSGTKKKKGLLIHPALIKTKD